VRFSVSSATIGEEQVYRSLRATGVRFHYGYATFLCSSDFPVHCKLIAYCAEFTCKLSLYCASRNLGDCAIAPRNRPTQAASRWQSARSPIRPALSDAGIRRRKTHDRTPRLNSGYRCAGVTPGETQPGRDRRDFSFVIGNPFVGVFSRGKWNATIRRYREC
jgi:hypothetical protein